MNSQHIKHQGIVQGFDRDTVNVMILAQSACASCHSKTSCGLSEMKEKIIQVPLSIEHFEKGEKVNVIMGESLGMFAVLLSYVFPIILFIALMIIVFNYTASEPMAGLVSVLALTAYYFVLFSFRKKLKKKFSFKIEKI